jgi:hypothetical protein
MILRDDWAQQGGFLTARVSDKEEHLNGLLTSWQMMLAVAGNLALLLPGATVHGLLMWLEHLKE